MNKFLVFKLGQSDYAVPLLKIKEVIASSAITSVPMNPEHIKGIINLRGELITIIDLRLKFNMPEGNEFNENPVVIMDIDHRKIGVVVDSVTHVINATEENQNDIPDNVIHLKNKFIENVIYSENKLLLVLNVDNMFSQQNALAA